MTRSARSDLVTLLISVFLAGCGSCGRTETPAPAAKPAAQAPATAAAAATTPQAAAPQAAQPPAAEEPDCFVIVDADPDFGEPPLTTHFTTEIDCTAEPVTYSWDFGDGTTGGNEANPTHVYQKVGEYLATVTVTAPDGGKGDDEIDIIVEEDEKE